jgi:hypothetical protein
MAVIAFVLLGCAVVAMGQQRIDLADRFTGKIADPSLADARPDSGIINDLAAWQKLWSAWRPGQPIKEVDFAQQIVLVDTVPGPNMVFSSLLQLDEQGDLKYEIASQRGAGPGFGYLIMIVSKTGINSVNGKSLDGKPIEARPIAKTPNEAAPQTKPDNRPVPPVTDQTASEPKPSLGTPGVDPNTAGMEFVKVEMVGRVRAQFQSVGPETTGTLVAANGIIWELDLHQDEQLMETARGLGNSLARISGDLRMLRQRGGLEARVRWIVHVESMESLGIEAGMPPATSPLEELNSPRNAQPIAGNDRPNPAPNSPMESNPGQSPPLQPNQTPSQSVPDSAVLDAPIRPSFTLPSSIGSWPRQLGI